MLFKRNFRTKIKPSNMIRPLLLSAFFFASFFVNTIFGQCTQSITNSNATVVVNSGVRLCINGSFSGTVLVRSGGTASILGNITSSGSISIDAGGFLDVCGNLAVTGSLINSGTIRKSPSTTITSYGSVILGTVNSSAANATLCSVLLPVELLFFDAKSNDENVVLTWQTASEINADYFEVWSSTDGVNYRVVTKLKAAGTSAQINSYSYIDANPSLGISYYKLVQFDFDGTKTEFDPISNIYSSSSSKMKVYPNPVLDGECFIQFQSEMTDEFSIQVFDDLGRLVLQDYALVQEGSNQVALHLNSLIADGVYFITITSGNQINTSRIVVNRKN
jgi:hypothetical protein